MMPAHEGSIDFAQARLSARFGMLPDELLWARLGSLREHAMLLDTLRASTLGRWVRGVLPSDDVHAVESHLRLGWHDEVRQVAAWMPPAWQEAVLWWRWWLDLMLLQHLARTHTVAAWLEHDPLYRDLASPVLQAKVRQLAALLGEDDGAQAWVAGWRERCPDPDAFALRALARLVRPVHATHDGTAMSTPRRQVRRAAVLLFRRSVLEPAAAFCYLAIVAVDVQRLRGELVRSVVFGARKAQG